jgi:hypothetical protein
MVRNSTLGEFSPNLVTLLPWQAHQLTALSPK